MVINFQNRDLKSKRNISILVFILITLGHYFVDKTTFFSAKHPPAIELSYEEVHKKRVLFIDSILKINQFKNNIFGAYTKLCSEEFIQCNIPDCVPQHGNKNFHFGLDEVVSISPSPFSWTGTKIPPFDMKTTYFMNQNLGRFQLQFGFDYGEFKTQNIQAVMHLVDSNDISINTLKSDAILNLKDFKTLLE